MEQRRLASTEWVDIVNEENEVIAQASREQMRAQCLRHRATYIVVHDGMEQKVWSTVVPNKDFYRHVGWAAVRLAGRAVEAAAQVASRKLKVEHCRCLAEHGQFYFEIKPPCLEAR